MQLLAVGFSFSEKGIDDLDSDASFQSSNGSKKITTGEIFPIVEGIVRRIAVRVKDTLTELRPEVGGAALEEREKTPKGKDEQGRDWDAINVEVLRGLM